MLDLESYGAMVCGVADEDDEEDDYRSPIPHLLGHYQA
jgi:hypothetical protein